MNRQTILVPTPPNLKVDDAARYFGELHPLSGGHHHWYALGRANPYTRKYHSKLNPCGQLAEEASRKIEHLRIASLDAFGENEGIIGR
jgi:hypothetical protein